MAHSSPEGIILSKGSKLVSMELSINKEKVLSIKKTKYTKYLEEESGNYVYDLELSDGTLVEKVPESLALYLHKLEQYRDGVKLDESNL